MAFCGNSDGPVSPHLNKPDAGIQFDSIGRQPFPDQQLTFRGGPFFCDIRMTFLTQTLTLVMAEAALEWFKSGIMQFAESVRQEIAAEGGELLDRDVLFATFEGRR